SINGRITNGKDAVADQFPYQLGLAFSSSQGSWWCGGSLINTRWALTAAHCTDGASSVTVNFGATVRTSPKLTQTVSSSNFIQHESYSSSIIRNDISLIKLSEVALSAAINTIALPASSSSYTSLVGKTAVASGWGLTKDTDTAVTKNLQYVDLEIISKEICKNTFGFIVTDRNLCVGTDNKSSTCQGDSGGPLVYDGTLIGATSFGSAAGCEVGAPAVFTNVAYYVPWILANTDIKHSDIIIHSGWNSSILKNDISLIKIPSVTYSSKIQAVKLPAIASSYSTYAGDSAIASGWGRDSDSSSSVSNILNYVTLTVITNSACASTYGSAVVTSSTLCVATPNGQSTCNGDSGGPLVQESSKVLIGATSFGASVGCEKGYPAAFTRVSSYLNWIKTNTGI
ncbi:hypothetical protein KR084_002809, partial [Drosophila pseudotakahashii]